VPAQKAHVTFDPARVRRSN